MKSILLILLLAIAAPALAQDEITQATIDSIDANIFEKVDVEADYPGGNKAWQNYIVNSPEMQKTIKKAARKVKKAGKYTVIVQFIVDKKGNVTDVEAITNNGYGLEEGAVEIIKKSGKWKPAEQNGKKVKAYRKQPITFFFE